MTRSAIEGRFGILVWGTDKKGKQIKVLINTRDQKTARQAAAAALADLGARTHFFINRGEALSQPAIPRRHKRPCLYTMR